MPSVSIAYTAPRKEPTLPPTKGSFTQWARKGGYYLPTGETCVSLPVGSYNIITVDEGIAFQPFSIYTDDLLELPDSANQAILANIQKFWESEEAFLRYGQLFKRGVLLHGAAGTGKSSIIALLSQDVLSRGGIVMKSSLHPSTIELALSYFRQVEPERPLVFIVEDIEEITREHGERQWLSLLDGQAQIPKVCFIATTNFPDTLGARFTNRPSRFDEVVEIKPPSAKARAFYLEKKALGLAPETREKWVEDTDGLSMAAMRELVVGVLCLGRPYDEILEKLRKMQRMLKAAPEFSSAGLGFGGGRG